MNSEVMEIPKEVEKKFAQADALDQRAREIRQQALEEMRERNRKFVREMEDKVLNRSQCLEYLSINTLESLKNWENKYRPYGYLEFEDNKILRSELLEFIDDLNSGVIDKKMNPK
jgi:hypothetical protein